MKLIFLFLVDKEQFIFKRYIKNNIIDRKYQSFFNYSD
jgi:hypothetical protein